MKNKNLSTPFQYLSTTFSLPFQLGNEVKLSLKQEVTDNLSKNRRNAMIEDCVTERKDAIDTSIGEYIFYLTALKYSPIRFNLAEDLTLVEDLRFDNEK